MSFPLIAIIGAGNMGSSLITGLIHNGHPKDRIHATDLSQEKLTSLETEFGIKTSQDNATIVRLADVVIFAVKPQIMAQTVKELASVIAINQPLIISIAAGVPETSIRRWLGGAPAIVRAMPNTPALLGEGATGLFANPNVSPAQHEIAGAILEAVSVIVWVQDEAQLDVVTAVSGSGPAYFFMIMEAIEKAGVELGLSMELTHSLVVQTALGAAKMAKENKLSLEELRKQVTSPGGTTEKALQVLEQHEFVPIIKKAITAAKLRSEELAKTYGNE